MRPSPHAEPRPSQIAEDMDTRMMRTLLLNETSTLLATGHPTLALVCPSIHPVRIAALGITGWRLFAVPTDMSGDSHSSCDQLLHTVYSVGGLRTVHLADSIGAPQQSAITIPMTPVWTASRLNRDLRE
jgi:hypothetical protein